MKKDKKLYGKIAYLLNTCNPSKEQLGLTIENMTSGPTIEFINM